MVPFVPGTLLVTYPPVQVAVPVSPLLPLATVLVVAPSYGGDPAGAATETQGNPDDCCGGVMTREAANHDRYVFVDEPLPSLPLPVNVIDLIPLGILTVVEDVYVTGGGSFCTGSGSITPPPARSILQHNESCLSYILTDNVCNVGSIRGDN